jgi:hypothetical protein
MFRCKLCHNSGFITDVENVSNSELCVCEYGQQERVVQRQMTESLQRKLKEVGQGLAPASPTAPAVDMYQGRPYPFID